MKKTTKKTLVSLPEEYRKKVYQPNTVTEAKYDYTLLQEKIFLYIVYYLQTYMLKVMNGTAIRQLELFAGDNSEYIDIDLPLSAIAKPRHYAQVRELASELITIKITIPFRESNAPRGTLTERTQGLLTHVDKITNEDGTPRRQGGILKLRMSKMVARLILNIERDEKGPINYTSFMFNIAMMASNKYTPRLYKLISSWKNRSGFKIKYERLREILQLGDKYKDYDSFKRWILIPVNEELKANADVFFNVGDLDFEMKEGKKITTLCFKILKPVENSNETEYKLWNMIYTKLQRIFQVDLTGIAIVKKIQGHHDPKLVHEKMNWAIEYMFNPEIIRSSKKIQDPPKWIVKILLHEFPVE